MCDPLPGGAIECATFRTEANSARRVVPVGSTFEEAERQVIIDALKSASGKIGGSGGAAERLGLKRTTLQNKMRRLSVARSDYSG
jgi:transcriptional regulator with GAF, ATPase, and Fis domain